MIDKNTLLAVVKLLSVAAEDTYPEGDVANESMYALRGFLAQVVRDVEFHFGDDVHEWYNSRCCHCEHGTLPDKRTHRDGA